MTIARILEPDHVRWDGVRPISIYLLRAAYLLIVVGIGAMIWPLLLGTPETAEHFRGVTWCLLSAVGVLALLGIRHPLTMLPILFFELIWKATWLITIGLPLRSAGQLDGAFAETFSNNLLGMVILPLVIPWGYVVRHIVPSRRTDA